MLTTSDLSQRAGHPGDQMLTLHGSLFDIKCSNDHCSWIQRGNFDDPFCPPLEPASVDMPNGETPPLLDPYHRIKHISESELPHCPLCKTGLQRPGVVWFGEDLDYGMLNRADNFIKEGKLVSPRIIGSTRLPTLTTAVRRT
jgi:NAD+-dependent protein deacetylase sirtuin 5